MAVNDLIPIVWLSGRFEQTAKPWLFLAFNANQAFESTKSDPPGFRRALTTSVAVAAILAVAILNLVLFLTCVPLDFGGWRAIPVGLTGAALFGTGIYWLIRREVLRSAEAARSRNQQALLNGRAIQTSESHLLLSGSVAGAGFRLLIFVGSWLMGGLTCLMWAFGANTLLDNTVPVDEVVVVTSVHRNQNDSSEEIGFHRQNDPARIYTFSVSGRNRPVVAVAPGSRLKVAWHPGLFRMPWIDQIRAAP